MVVGAVVTAFVLRDGFVAAHRTVGWVVASAVVAMLIDPLVDVVDRVLPRWISVILVLLVVLGIVASIVIGLANELLDSIERARRRAPPRRPPSSRSATTGWPASTSPARVRGRSSTTSTTRVREDAVSRAAQTVPTYIVTGILMLFLLGYGRRYFEGFVNQFPEQRRDDVREVGSRAVLRGRLYLLATLGESILFGLLIGWLCWTLDLPAAIGLGFAVAVFTPIPLIGVLVGGVPALLLAFGLGRRGGRVPSSSSPS